MGGYPSMQCDRHPPGRHQEDPPPQEDTPHEDTRKTPQEDRPAGRHPQEDRRPQADGYCCKWYASYWNACLFTMLFRSLTPLILNYWV